MPLSRALANVILANPCPHCGHTLEKKGSWFQTVGRYRCEACQQEVSIRYDDKVKLFEAHAHLANC
jgi:transposase-like protein